MKYSYSIIMVIALTIYSCNKDDDNMDHGEANAIVNGSPWQAKPYGGWAPAYPEGYIGIVAEMYNDDGFLRQDISFHKIPLEEGVFELGRILHPHDYPYIGAAFFTLQGGDVLGDIYLLDTLANDNYFEVVDYAANRKEIEVKFAATFLLDRRANASAPDTIKFEDGYIKTQISN